MYGSFLKLVLKSSHEDRLKLYHEDWFEYYLIKSYLNFESDWLELKERFEVIGQKSESRIDSWNS